MKMEKSFLFMVLVFVLANAYRIDAAWDSRVRQGYQTRQQFFNPQNVRSWLDDTVSSATMRTIETGPITEIESIYDFSFLKGTMSVGIFARVLTYAGASYSVLVTPLLFYQDKAQQFQAGRMTTAPQGSGLLIGTESVLGVRYTHRRFHWESDIFYYGLLESSGFQKDVINVFGYRETVRLANGELGAMLLIDESSEVTDTSRVASESGVYTSISGDWEFESDWFLQAEGAYGNQGFAAFVGCDIPILPFLSWQTRMRYQNEGFAPLLGMYARDVGKQSVFSIRIPLDFFSEQLLITPRFGFKHTPQRDYWVPGLSIENLFFQVFWIRGLLMAEQPCDAWGDKQHYEYAQLQMIWMLTETVFIDFTWLKTFDGFLDWKEIQNKAGVEWRW